MSPGTTRLLFPLLVLAGCDVAGERGCYRDEDCDAEEFCDGGRLPTACDGLRASTPCFPDLGEQGTCADRHGAGEPCCPGSFCLLGPSPLCRTDLVCATAGGQEPTCRKPSPLGTPCDFDTECEGAVAADESARTICDAGAGVCAPPLSAKAGARCTKNRACERGLACRQGYCAP
jgi:hypothetical protein